MREINAIEIGQAISRLAIQTNLELSDDALELLKKAKQNERSPIGRNVIDKLIENANIAKYERIPLCQDCGIAVIFLDVGQEVHICGDLMASVEEGVRQGYKEGFLRNSVVAHPFSSRINTGTNTPAIIHSEIVPGEKVKIHFMPKGGGSENMSRLVMLKPSDGIKGINSAVTSAVKEAGGKPCPPLLIGLGIGATAEKAMISAKRVLFRTIGYPNDDPEVAALEKAVLENVNKLGIGPLGMGGTTTALAVHAEAHPCHFASLPLAINLQCHSIRHGEIVL